MGMRYSLRRLCHGVPVIPLRLFITNSLTSQLTINGLVKEDDSYHRTETSEIVRARKYLLE